eukprot:TRINITY_DN6269_c0_g1_i1.p1 TRINITY_DN6269_c0_g1~~TRINITY_DN6269_c0_g1_i1.p1  ORF type:complete len:240 (-),score=20.67 TRINITY_DN6269_c0_g1_i1:474-1193(-)
MLAKQKGGAKIDGGSSCLLMRQSPSMAVTRDLLAPSAPRIAKPCQRPRRTQRMAVPASLAEMEEANGVIAFLQDILLRERESQSIDPSMLQLLSENPALADFVLEGLAQEPLHKSASVQSTSSTSSTCSESLESIDICGYEEECSSSSLGSVFLGEALVPLDRYRRDASKIGSGRAIEFLELARNCLQQSEYAALLELFCSFDEMEVTEEMEERMWALISLDCELTCRFQMLFPSLSRM